MTFFYAAAQVAQRGSSCLKLRFGRERHVGQVPPDARRNLCLRRSVIGLWGLKGLTAATAVLASVAANAADLGEKQLPPAAAAASTPIDFAFGARVQTDYNFRGISQSDRRPSASGYGELQLFDNFVYAGVAAYAV